MNLRDPQERLFLLLAIFIGLFSGSAVVCFRVVIEWVRIALLGSALRPDPLRTVLVPTVAGLVIGLLVAYVFPFARGSGVNQTKAALYIYDGYIAFPTVVGKFLTSSLAIGSGHSLGPEDPSLQIGAGLASTVARGLKLSRDKVRLIAPLGAAAGLSAAFNSPIAAVLFVIEEVIGRWSAGVLGAVILSAAAGVVSAQWFLGGAPLFRVPAVAFVHPAELLGYAALGIIGGLAAVLFLKIVLAARPRLFAAPRAVRVAQPALAGLAIGTVGLWFPQVMGAGYETVDQAVHGQFTWQLLATLAALKLVATALSFSTGTPGGLFAPTLFMGAMLGGAVGGLQRTLLPELTGPVGVYALVGMGTLFAGILRAPMTSVFMILELTGNYTIILPVMVSNTIAYLVSRNLQPVPIFDALSRQEGLDLPSMEEQRDLAVLRVEDAMRPWAGTILPVTATVSQVMELSGGEALVLLGGDGLRWHAVRREQLRRLAEEGQQQRTAADAENRLAHLHPDQPLESALRLLRDSPVLPVVHRADFGQLVGVVALEDVLRAYRADRRSADRGPAAEVRAGALKSR
ncbi:MAG TPA: chloride channel protein [Vicinamibacteria bacterium]|nr:chloride channel protein [Vicinamibacteria bacterium]